jgi:DNA invertase Pin-like site-specific DNA recombinase
MTHVHRHIVHRNMKIGLEPTQASFRLRQDLDSNESGRGQGQRPRQRRAIQAYANRAGYKIVAWFDDGDVKGADPIDTRKGFAEMMEAIAANGCRTIIVETANS